MRESWKAQKRGIILVGTVAAITMVVGWNSSVRAVFIGCALLVLADVSQAIQMIIGINWLTSDDTINLIFSIDYTMSADTNNVLGIRGVTLPTGNPNRGEIWFYAIRLPNFPTLYAAASLYAMPSTPPPSVPLPPPLTPHHSHCQPRPRPRLWPRCRQRCPRRCPWPSSPSPTLWHRPWLLLRPRRDPPTFSAAISGIKIRQPSRPCTQGWLAGSISPATFSPAPGFEDLHATHKIHDQYMSWKILYLSQSHLLICCCYYE
jgi:hypothetical protein